MPYNSGLHLARKSGKSGVGLTGSPVPSTSGCQVTRRDLSSGDDDSEPLVAVPRPTHDACDTSMTILVSSQSDQPLLKSIFAIAVFHASSAQVFNLNGNVAFQ